MSRFSLSLGTFLGMRIKVHAVFLLLLLLYALTNLLTEALLVFTVVVFHELGHTMAARGYGIRVKEIELLPIGGVARLEDLMSIDPQVEAAVAVAGPINNVLLIAAGLFLRRMLHLPEDSMSFFLQANLMIMGFNMIPALPLDGGRIYRATLTKRLGFRKATEKAARLGQWASVFFMVGCVLMAVMGHLNLVLLVTAYFIYQVAGKEQNLAAYSLMSYLGRKQDEVSKHRVLGVEQLVVHPTTPIKEVIKHFVPQKYHIIWIITDEKLERSITEAQLLHAMLEKGIETMVGEIR